MGGKRHTVAEGSIRLGILKAPSCFNTVTYTRRVAEGSIRLGILKDWRKAQLLIMRLSCRGLDPIGDTESLEDYRFLCVTTSCRGLDPIGDTESRAEVAVFADTGCECCRGLDPIGDTESRIASR